MGQNHPVRSRLAALIKEELGGEAFHTLSEKIEVETGEKVSPQAISRLANNLFNRVDCSNLAALCFYGGWNIEDVLYLERDGGGDPGVLLLRQVRREQYIINRVKQRAIEAGKSEEIEQACNVLLDYLGGLV